MVVLATAAFSTLTASARADVMPAGTYDAHVTGGTLSIGDADLQSIAVPAGDAFTVTIPAGASAPVAFRAPATHVPIGVHTFTDPSAGTWAASGSLDIAPIDGTVDAATGSVTGTAAAHGLLRLDFASSAGGTSLYCQLGDDPAPPETPVPPSPFALSLAGAWSAATGSAALADTTFALQLNCGAPFITPATDLEVVGHPVMASGMNALALAVKFTRRPDPAPPATVKPKPKPPVTTTPPKTVTPVVRCVVPKLKGLTLQKARKAAKKANCAVGSVKRKTSSRRATTVLKQARRAGTVLDQGSRINLTVAKPR